MKAITIIIISILSIVCVKLYRYFNIVISFNCLQSFKCKKKTIQIYKSFRLKTFFEKNKKKNNLKHMTLLTEMTHTNTALFFSQIFFIFLEKNKLHTRKQKGVSLYI